MKSRESSVIVNRFSIQFTVLGLFITFGPRLGVYLQDSVLHGPHGLYGFITLLNMIGLSIAFWKLPKGGGHKNSS